MEIETRFFDETLLPQCSFLFLFVKQPIQTATIVLIRLDHDMIFKTKMNVLASPQSPSGAARILRNRSHHAHLVAAYLVEHDHVKNDFDGIKSMFCAKQLKKLILSNKLLTKPRCYFARHVSWARNRTAPKF
jgi:hypothetical protein